MQISEAKNRVIKIMREFSNAGVVTAPSRNKDYTLSMNSFFDIVQKEIATTVKPILKRYDISQQTITSGFGANFGWETKIHDKEDMSYSTVGGLAYTFEVDNTATVNFKEETSPGVWTLLTTVDYIATNRGFTSFRGLLTPSDVTNTIKMEFSGDYYYKYKNYALYTQNFATVEDIPPYEPFVRHQMPPDFYNIKEIVREVDIADYQNYGAYRFERENNNVRIVRIPYNDSGEYRVIYMAYPTTINDDTLDTYEFELDEEAQEVMLYKVASLLKEDEDPNMSDKLLNTYNTMMNNLNEDDESQGLTLIFDAEGWS